MTLTSYLSYLAFAIVVIVAPGPDFALTVANTLRGGRTGGMLTSLGIATSNVVQGTAAALGLGALIVHSQLAFNVIRWAGVAYLCYLGVQTIRSAIKGQYAIDDTADVNGGRKAPAWLRFQQGFLSNITNPKVLTLYLSVLPQFLGTSAALPDALLLAYSHAFFGFAWLVVLVTFLHQIRAFLRRRRVRRTLDAATGVAMLGFGAKLATEAH
ncbi:LysE family translocator [Fodinicola acaciae]|uniref:LysE family translocator n=1 Tax=Fodinicola acaciae TaxID=2681555 RepID=UPI0013D59D3E|nr:LysE family translocator [Fodinicola acaciae]